MSDVKLYTIVYYLRVTVLKSPHKHLLQLLLLFDLFEISLLFLPVISLTGRERKPNQGPQIYRYNELSLTACHN